MVTTKDHEEADREAGVAAVLTCRDEISVGAQHCIISRDVCVFQPVGFITFHSKHDAEVARRELQVGTCITYTLRTSYVATRQLFHLSL